MASEKKSRSKAKRGKKNNNLILWLIGAGVIVLAAIPVVVNTLQRQNLPGEFFSSQGNTHVQLGTDTPDYNSNPPTSGWHTPDLAGWGSYDYVIPEQRIIHNMEDGGVIIWYELGTAEENEENIARLEEVSSGYRRVVIVPREGMPTPYAMTAWQRLQRFEDIDEENMRLFLESFEGIDHHPRG